MSYVVTFLEGVVTFISPCLLPMLPVYLIYFAGGEAGKSPRRALVNALGFVVGFTLVFAALGAFASAIGVALRMYHTAVNIVTGLIVVFFGLNFMGVFGRDLLGSSRGVGAGVRPVGFFSAILFGMVFAVGWTPCVGAFLGSALMLASQQASLWRGMALLLVYCAGLGLPFILSAVLVDRLKSAFDFIKKHYKVINIVCGALLAIVGVLMMTGVMSALLSALG